jgi:hypothetical protein
MVCGDEIASYEEIYVCVAKWRYNIGKVTQVRMVLYHVR